MNLWQESKTAYQLGLSGTVSATALALNLHRATVMRHVTTLERSLGQKLFLRHSRGFTLTDAGQEFMEAFCNAEDCLNLTLSQIKSKSIILSGTLVITLLERVFDLIEGTIFRFIGDHPGIKVNILTGNRPFKLEYGEAHVAIRIGAKPKEPDNIVLHLTDLKFSLYAHKSYVDHYGLPESIADFDKHRFIFLDIDITASFYEWTKKHIPDENYVLRTTEPVILERAIDEGIGIGIMEKPLTNASDYVEVIPAQPDWFVPLWIVTHMDLYQHVNIQRFTAHLKDWAAERSYPDLIDI